MSEEHYLEDGYYVGILEKEIERLHSIIKEVREYIENVETLATIDKVNIFSISTLKSILDKGDNHD